MRLSEPDILGCVTYITPKDNYSSLISCVLNATQTAKGALKFFSDINKV